MPQKVVKTNYASAETMAEVKFWVAECAKSHKKCANATPMPMPTRILRLSRDGKTVRLHPTDGQKAHYVALSYPWGGDLGFLTTKSSFETRSQPFPISDLPQTIQDAASVALQLSIRCLWVDSLCIIQDSHDDKTKEISRMDKIYQNTFVTISATNALSVYSGFLNHEYYDTSSHRLPLLYPDGSTGHAFIGEDPWYHIDPLDRRAWALQERYLSRRLLDYTSLGLKKSCREKKISDVPDPRKKAAKVTFSMTLATILDHEYGSNHDNRADLLRAWDKILRHYTQRQLTERQDKLPALGGLAIRFQERLQSEYVAGLWREYIPQGLLWHGVNAFQKTLFRRELTPLRRAVTHEAPTWSWASVEGPLLSEDGDTFDRGYEESYHKIDITVQISECKVTLKNPILPFGQVTGGLLQVSGYIRDCICKPSYIRQTELNVGSARLAITPDDFEEWSAALKGQTIRLLEIVRHSYEAGSTLNETNLLNMWQGSDAFWSVGLILISTPNGRYRRLGHFKEIDKVRHNYLFEKCSRTTVVIE